MRLPLFFVLLCLCLSNAPGIDVYIVAGQSNGWRLSQLKQGEGAEGPRLHYFGMDCVAEPESSRLQTLTRLSEQTMGYGLAQTLLNETGKEIVFVQYSRCGASIMGAARNSWWPGEDPANGKNFDEGLFGSFEKYLHSAKTQVEQDLGQKWEVKGLFWHQGESNSGSDKAAFERDLRNVFRRFRSLLGNDLPIVAGHIRDLGEGQRGVNAVLDKLAAGDPLMAAVSLEGLAFEPDRDGQPNVHIAKAGCDQLGRRMAAAMAHRRLAAAVTSAGGKIEMGSDGPFAIDLYNGNNPLKGKGGKNESIDDAWLERLSGLTSLRRLSLANCAITNDGLRHIAGLTGLEDLNLTLTAISDAGLAHLARLTELRSLGLASSQCTGSGFAHLKALRKLENVNCHFTPFNDEGLKAIAEVGVSGRLWLGHTHFTDEGAGSFAMLKDMRICGIGSKEKSSSGEAVAHLAGLTRLEDLSLLDNQATPEGIAHAAKIQGLRRLDVSYAPNVGDATLKLLAAHPKLEGLLIGGSALITDEGVLALAESGSLKKLTLQSLKKVSEEAVARFKKARPNVDLTLK
jgi:hypothetical protein